ncbi:hypothetical protein STENM327S_06147 [Streptomyces tendae]
MTGTDHACPPRRGWPPHSSHGAGRPVTTSAKPAPSPPSPASSASSPPPRAVTARSLTDLVGLQLGVRVDQPGTLLRDYHTYSDYRGVPLLSAKTNAKGQQTRTTPAKHTGVTRRSTSRTPSSSPPSGARRHPGAESREAVRNPVFPLSLGRRLRLPVSLGLRTDSPLKEALEDAVAGRQPPPPTGSGDHRVPGSHH